MKKIILFLLVLGSAMINRLNAQVKSAVYWTSPLMTLNQAAKIAKFDLAVVDLENMFNNKPSLDSLKKWNPKLILVCYSNPMEIFNRDYSSRPLQSAWADTIRQNYPQWLLKTDQRNQVVFYPGMSVLNLSSSCPTVKGKNYGQFMDSLLLNRVLSDTIWDGYFMDNGTANIYWLYHTNQGKLDANGDGRADDSLELNRAWAQGVRSFLEKIRQAKGKKFILIANKGVPIFMDILDGRMFENFPNDYLGDKTDGGWWQCLANAHQTGNYTIFQVKDEGGLNFAIASALLLNHPVYIAVGQDCDQSYRITNRLGSPDKIIIGRRFQNGFIEIIPSRREGKVYQEKK